MKALVKAALVKAVLVKAVLVKAALVKAALIKEALIKVDRKELQTMAVRMGARLKADQTVIRGQTLSTPGLHIK